jgi:cytochrome c oxidase subunit 4
MADHHDTEHGEHELHMGIPQYLIIFAILFVGTIITYFVALSDLDSKLFAGANTLVALLIAFFKMTCVVLYFMHVRWNGKLIWLTAAGSFVFLLIMFAFTIQDYLTRGSGIFTK